jgi:hypothetical protein
MSLKAALAWPWRSRRLTTTSSTEYIGSQVETTAVNHYDYTGRPWMLLAYDIYYFFYHIRSFPYIFWPMRPTDSKDLDELSWTIGNLFCIAIHSVLCILQVAFFLSLPLALLFPIWMVAIAMGGFAAVNFSLAWLLNGSADVYSSDAKYNPEDLDKYAHEQWIFLNGVAVG